MQRVHGVAQAQARSQLSARQIVMMVVSFGGCVLMSRVQLMGVLAPFAAAFCAAFYSLGNAGMLASLGCAVGMVLGGMQTSMVTAFVACGYALATVAALYGGFRLKEKLKTTLLVLLCGGAVLCSLQSPYTAIITALEGVLVFVIKLVVVQGAQALKGLRAQRALTQTQALCALCTVGMLLMGLGGITVMTMSVLHIVAAAFLLAMSLCLPPSVCGAMGLFIGLCATLCGAASSTLVANLGLCGLICGYCAQLYKLGAILSFLMTHALLIFAQWSGLLALTTAEALLAAALCLLTPMRLIDLCTALLNPGEPSGAKPKQQGSQRTAQRLHEVAAAMEQTVVAMEGLNNQSARSARTQLALAAQEVHRTALTVGTGEKIDQKLAMDIVNRLQIAGHEGVEVIASGIGGGLEVRVSLRPCGGKGACHKEVQRVVSQACRRPMARQEDKPCSPRRRSCTHVYAPKAGLSIDGGVATSAKQGERVNGDVFLHSELGEDRELFCLCDGMGSGQRAHDTAALAAQLIQRYFGAGYDQSKALEAVNQLLAMRRSEVFTAADLLVVDKRRGEVQFIKTCAAPSYLWHRGTLERIELSALPMGVLQEMRPALLKRKVQRGDKLIMLSDGVADQIHTLPKKQLTALLSSELPAAQMADELIEWAQKSGGAMDDMTAVVLILHG